MKHLPTGLAAAGLLVSCTVYAQQTDAPNISRIGEQLIDQQLNHRRDTEALRRQLEKETISAEIQQQVSKRKELERQAKGEDELEDFSFPQRDSVRRQLPTASADSMMDFDDPEPRRERPEPEPERGPTPKLVGIIDGDTAVMNLEGEIKRVSKGSAIGDFRVVEIGHRSVRLEYAKKRKNDQPVVLSLRS